MKPPSVQGWGIGGLSYGQVTTSIYLKVSISDFLTLFSARTGDDFWWTSRPAPILFGAGCVALTASTIIAVAWPQSAPDGIYALGLGRAKVSKYCLFVCILFIELKKLNFNFSLTLWRSTYGFTVSCGGGFRTS